MMDDLPETATTSELAKLIAGPHGDVDLALRRVRHWTLAGALLPTAESARGSAGRTRLYSRHAIYVAAVLNDLTEFGLTIDLLKKAAAALEPHNPSDPRFDKVKREQRELWDQAVSGKFPVLLTVSEGGGSALVPDGHPVHVSGWPVTYINVTQAVNRLRGHQNVESLLKGEGWPKP
jgi:DNA-binding transcriptional MerR regulator